MSGAPEPSFEGDLSRTPFLHLVAQIHTRGLSGTLAIWPDAEGVRGQDRIRFEAGAPVGARLLDPSTPVLDRALAPFFARASGAYAFYEGIDLTGTGATAGKVDPLALLAASLRTTVRQDALEAVLAQFEGTLLRFRSGTEIRRYQFLPKEERLLDVVRAGPSTAAELADCSELGPELGRRLVYLLIVTRAVEPYERPSRPSTVSEPKRRSQPRQSAPPGHGEVALSADAIASALAAPALEIDDTALRAAPRGQTPRVGSDPPPAAPREDVRATPRRGPRAPVRVSDAPPPPDLSPEGQAFFEEVQMRLEAIDTQNYYEMLEVPRDANAETIRSQYFAQVRRWHPDRLAPELAFLRADVDTIFQLLTTAHDTLVDESKRGKYLRTVQDGGGTPVSERKLAAIVGAAMEQQKAEVLMRRRDYAGAQVLLEKAIELNPDEPDLHASYAGCLLQLPGGDAHLPEVLRRTEQVLAAAPTHDRAHYYRAMALRRVGREAEALEHFTKAAEANPKNIDAVREVRLAAMRGTGPASAEAKAASDGGFFGKLFGSKKKS